MPLPSLFSPGLNFFGACPFTVWVYRACRSPHTAVRFRFAAGKLEQLFDGAILVIMAILVRGEQDCQAIFFISPYLPHLLADWLDQDCKIASNLAHPPCPTCPTCWPTNVTFGDQHSNVAWQSCSHPLQSWSKGQTSRGDQDCKIAWHCCSNNCSKFPAQCVVCFCTVWVCGLVQT